MHVNEWGGNSSLSKAAVAEQIAVSASGLVRMASASGLHRLAELIEAVVLEAWREASEPDPGHLGAQRASPAE